MIRDIQRGDKNEFLDMAQHFYTSNAVDHAVDFCNFEKTFYEAINKSPFLRLLISEHDGIVEGYCLLAITFSNEAGGKVVWIEEVFIKDTFRGHGIGSQFFKFIESEYQNAARFRLEVKADNMGAISLYKNLGYKNLEYIQMIKDLNS